MFPRESIPGMWNCRKQQAGVKLQLTETALQRSCGYVVKLALSLVRSGVLVNINFVDPIFGKFLRLI